MLTTKCKQILRESEEIFHNCKLASFLLWKLIKMVYCSVVNCHRNPKTDSGKVKFYRFPKRNLEQRGLWIKAVKRIGANGKPWEPSKFSIICSDHFVNGEKSPTSNHPSYVPTIFPTQHLKPLGNDQLKRFKRASHRNKIKEECNRVSPNEGELTEIVKS